MYEFIPPGEKWEGFFSVNVDSAEGDLSRMPPEEVMGWFPKSWEVVSCATPQALKTALEERRKGKSLSRWFFLFALLLFLLESWLAGCLIPRGQSISDLEKIEKIKGKTS